MANGVEAIVLAAGASRRMGRCKPLLPLGDDPAIVRLIRTLRAGGAVLPGGAAARSRQTISRYPSRSRLRV